MMGKNILFCSVGRRGDLVKDFRASLDRNSKIVATDNNSTAPGLYFADRQYIVPKINEENYVPIILEICRAEEIGAVTTLIDPEIAVLARHREKFQAMGVQVLAPYETSAALCFDKYLMYQFLNKHGILTAKTYGRMEEFQTALEKGDIQFPVFVKPRTGSGSVGARMIQCLEELKIAFRHDRSLIIQEYMTGEDLDADVYVDTISHRAVSIFTKKKLETKIGGANKTLSFKDNKLFLTIEHIVSFFEFNGPIDMDFFYRDGEYYLSEINPRFGGAYLHAYGCGVNFIKLIENNMNGIENEPVFGNYEEDVLMMMYDSVVIKKKREIKEQVEAKLWTYCI
ncbi:MAG: ATP-grasp domain-containing protein [Lachnospiraceae bacterium]|nr:ATP-grasp domain-containing protein [Lachnospiraceae bacterium]